MVLLVLWCVEIYFNCEHKASTEDTPDVWLSSLLQFRTADTPVATCFLKPGEAESRQGRMEQEVQLLRDQLGRQAEEASSARQTSSQAEQGLAAWRQKAEALQSQLAEQRARHPGLEWPDAKSGAQVNFNRLWDKRPLLWRDGILHLSNREPPLFVGIYWGINIPGLLRWCEMDFVHPQYVRVRNMSRGF